MKKSIWPSTINGVIKAPASKSVMQRAVAAAVLSNRSVRLTNPSNSDDARAALQVAVSLGATVTGADNRVDIRGGINPTGNSLDCEEAGLCLRMMCPIAALWPHSITLTGSGSLKVRPVDMMAEPLEQLGVSFRSNRGFIPVTIKGPLRPGTVTVDGSSSSQFLTGLLMALPTLEGDSSIRVTNLKSKPYIDLTLKTMESFGVSVSRAEYSVFDIPGRQKYRCDAFEIEGDWSGAAVMLVAGAISGRVRITGLDPDSVQADRRILDALSRAGAGLIISSNEVEAYQQQLRGFTFDAEDCPDLFPPLVALASFCRGTTTISGVRRLIHKESNRSISLSREFNNLGGSIHVFGNKMKIQGFPLKGGEVNAHGDHRIAMALAIASLRADSPVTIMGADTVSKSYPDFFFDLQSVGGKTDE